MTTTDTDALTERIARELFLCERWNFRDGRPDREKTPEGDRAERERMAALWDAEAGKPWHESQWPSFRQTYPRLAAAVLPIVAVEVQAAKAKALRDAAARIAEEKRLRTKATAAATEAEARIKAVQHLIDQADEAGDWTVTCSRLQWAIDGEVV